MPDTTNIAGKARENSEKIAESGNEAASNVAQTMVDVARLAMDQGQEAVRLCFTTMSSANAPVAESTYAQSRQMIANGATMLDFYRQAVDRSMDDVQAMMNSCANLGRGMHRWQRTYTDAVRQTVDKFGEKPQRLLQCTTPEDLARMQRDLYFDMIGGMMTYGVAALQALSQATQEALTPLNERARRPV